MLDKDALRSGCVGEADQGDATRRCFFFFFNDRAPTEIPPLPPPAALPIKEGRGGKGGGFPRPRRAGGTLRGDKGKQAAAGGGGGPPVPRARVHGGHGGQEPAGRGDLR